MTRNEQPAPGGYREAGPDHYSRSKYSPPATLSSHVQFLYDHARACTCCHGPILPLDRRGNLCGTCADWISGKTFRDDVARANAMRALRLRRIGGRRVLVDLVMQVVRDELFGHWEVA